jgi:hypothetical protein
MNQEYKTMEQIETALLAGQRKVELQGIEIDLNPPLKNDTTNNKRKEAHKRALAILKIIRE